MKNNQKGFSAVEALIVIVVAGILGTVGWFVYSNQSKESNTEAKNQQQEQPKTDFTYTGITIPSDWKTYENKEYGFSFQYPADFKISEGKFKDGESGDKAVFVASANPPAEQGVGGYSLRVLKTNLNDAVKNDALNTNDNAYEDTIKQTNIYKSGYNTIELSYVPDGMKVSWFFVEKDPNTVLRFELVEDSGDNSKETKAIYNSLVVN